MKTLQERVIRRMADLKLNTTQLAKRMGKYQSTIRGFVSGETQTFRDMTGLAKALETTPQWLLTGEGSPDLKTNREVTPIEADPDYQEILILAFDLWKEKGCPVPARKMLEIARKLYSERNDITPGKLSSIASSMIDLVS